MLSWLVKKGQNARVYMCIKEVLWDLENTDGVRRATLLMLAQWLRLTLIEEEHQINNILDRPLDYPRNDTIQFYEMFETIRNNAIVQANHLQKTLPRYGINIPEFAVDHFKNTNRGIEIWMCTVGCGIVPDRRDEVRKIWQILHSSHPHVPAAIQRLKNIESAMQEITGDSGNSMFSAITTEDWLAGSDFIPSMFKTELRLL